MRVLLTSVAVYSHLVPTVVPVARALQAAGHEVVVATGGVLADELDRFGVAYRSMPRMLAPSQFGSDPEVARRMGFSPEGKALPELEELGRTRGRGAVMGRIFAGLAAERAAQDMLGILSDFRPDLVVRECTEFGGYLVAEKLGVPCVTLDGAPLAVTRDLGMLPWLNESRAAVGLPPVDDTSSLTRDLWVSWLPEVWYPTGRRSTAHRYYRGPQEESQQLDPAIARLPDNRPFVLATLGTHSNQILSPAASPFRRIIEALGSLPYTAVVALGRDTDPATWTGPRPSNVHLASFVQQPLLLQACDLFVTHAGFGSALEALRVGVPMVALPLFAEQPANAQRLTELGLGVTTDPYQADPATIAVACQKVLGDPSYRFTCRGFQRRILALPGMDQLVADLTALA